MKKGIGSFFVILLIAIVSLVVSFAIGALLPVWTPHTHKFGEWTVVAEATCLEQGLKERTCECGVKETENISANGHNYEVVVIGSSCTTPGYTTYTCHCGDTYMDNHISEQGHNEVEHAAQAPTCTEIGWDAYVTCSRCDYTTYKEIPALGHDYTEAVIEPSCTQQGYTSHTCSICNYSYNDTYIDAKGHTYEETVTPATCTSKGYTTYNCACGESYVGNYVEIVAHAYTAVETVATCTSKGYTTYTCSCGDSYVDNYVAALGHTLVTDAAVAATCTTTGLTEGSHCSICKQTLVEQTVVNALGHTVVTDAAVAATCTTTGLTEGSHCTVCNTVIVAQQTVVELGHDKVQHEGKAATCAEIGWAAYETCSRCDYTTYLAQPALDHVVVVDEAVAPTCTTIGLTEGSHCSICKQIIVKQTVVDALGHTEVVDQAVAPTCTATGLTEGKHCSVCDVVLVAQQTVSATGHTNGAVVVENNVAPTCTEDGSYDNVVYCAVCGEEVSRNTVEVSAPGHTEEIDEAVAPKCTTMGKTEGKHCSVCNEVLVPQQAVASLGHTLGAVVVENNVAPTCTQAGSYDNVVYCTVCDVELNRNTVVVPSAGHTHTAVVTAPTCTEQGYTTHTCACGDTYVDSYVNALGHTEVVDQAVAPTCTATGLTEGKHCSVCDVVLEAQTVVDALGHTEVIDAAVAATCTTTGLTEGKHCSVCHVVLEAQTVVDALGHTEVIDAAVAPKCTTMGKTEGKHCSVCNEVLVPQQALAPLGHTLGAVVVQNNVAPTCTQAGSYDNVVYCTVCDVELNRNTVVVPSTGHTHTAVVTAPTCTEQGYTTHTCACGDTYIDTYVDALGHTHTAVVTAPTCTEQGYTTHTCACGDTYIDTYVDALGHTEYTIPALAPTCTEDGHTQSKYCSVCETVLVARQILLATGHDEVSHEAKAPNCTEYGWDAYVTCSNCDYTTYNQLSALGHDEVSHEAKTPNCTEYGWDAYVTCSNCDYTTYKKINAKGHRTEYHHESDGCLTHYWYECSVCGLITSENRYGSHWYGSEQVYIQPTCEQPGYTIYQCQSCDYSYTEEGEPAKGGTCQYDDGVIITATCEHEGYTLYTCQICGGIRKENIVPPTQHILGHIQNTYQGSCDYDGSISYWCAVCYQTVTETIPAPGHDYEFLYKNDPTCSNQGYTTYKCKNCGSQIIKDYVDALGHIPAGPPIFIEGSCTTSSYYMYRCSVCGYSYYEYLYDNDGHDLGEELIIRNPTCTTPGLKVATCNTCGVEVQQSMDYLPHNYVDIVVEPTCVSEGYSASKCLDCGYVQRDWSAPTLPRLDHDYICHEGQEATCTTPGWSAYQTCGRDGCDFNTYKDLPINPENHVFFDSEVCVHCGNVNMTDYIVDTLDISATENDHVTAYVVNYKGIYTLHIKGDGAMRDFSYDKPLHTYLDYDITKVYVDEGVTNIGAFIFNSGNIKCSFTSVTIATSVKIIGERAFYFVDTLRSVIFVDGSKCEEIGQEAFYHTSLYNVTIPNSVKIIRQGAYWLYGWAHSVYIEENSQLTTLEDYVFRNITVDEFVVPASLCHIGEDALPQSRRYVVEQGNPYYMSIDGNLYTADGKTLIVYAVGSDDVHAVVPAGVTTIAPSALSFSQLKSVELPDTLVEIGKNAFMDASLSSITIPSSVEIIGNWAFCYCSDLTDIVIQGNPRIGLGAFTGTAFYEDISRWENDMLYVGTCLISTKPTQPVVTIKQGTTSLASYSLVYHESTGGMQANQTITTLIIPTSVTLIEDNFNGNCNNLDTIYYAGSEEQWNAIDIVDEFDLNDITIYFNYTGE